ncbi:MAG: SLC13 family permease [Burkholderiales bacterium]
MKLSSLLTTAVVIAATVIFLLPAPAGVAPHTMHAGALLVLVMGLWAIGSLPEYLVALLFFALAILLKIASPAVIFSGFASGTLWLVLGGLLLAEAVRATGLGERIARSVLGERSLTYRQLVMAAVLVSVVLSFLMPATVGRILLLVPILAAVAERHGLRPGSAGHNGVLLATILATFQCGTAILPANAPNLVLAGAAETLYNVQLIYAEYLWVQFPVMGLIKGALIIAVTCWLFPAQTQAATAAAELRVMSGEEKRLLAILCIALALWATDFLHHIHSGWIALAAAVLVMMPRIGAVPGGMFQERVRFGAFFYVGAILGLGSVMLDSGVSTAIGQALLSVIVLERGADATNFGILSLIATFAGLITTNPSQPALLAPLAGHIAEATGWPIKTALMTIAIGFSTLILPYQVPPVVVGLQVAHLSVRTALGITAVLALISIVALIPLSYLWWRVIGYIGS